MKKIWAILPIVIKTVIGSAMFALGFNLFLEPNDLNAGGISGFAMALVHLMDFGSVGLVTALINLPLFAIGGIKVGKKFFVGSLLGMACVSVFIDLFALIPRPDVQPLLAAVYGGAICGLGIGIVFSSGVSTGGSDIIVRLLKMKWRNVPIGVINICFDFAVAAFTGIVFQDINRALYSGVAIFISGQVIDAVVYRFDYSRVALIITAHHEVVAREIAKQLDRGATFLNGEGSYSRKETKVVLTAVKRQQLAQLKQLVSELDPDAFIIVQEAHQVLGDGFSRYTKDSL